VIYIHVKIPLTKRAYQVLFACPLSLYYLYALYITSFSVIEWLLPLEIDRAKSISIDLYNDNANQIINKKD